MTLPLLDAISHLTRVDWTLKQRQQWSSPCDFRQRYISMSFDVTGDIGQIALPLLVRAIGLFSLPRLHTANVAQEFPKVAKDLWAPSDESLHVILRNNRKRMVCKLRKDIVYRLATVGVEFVQEGDHFLLPKNPLPCRLPCGLGFF